MSHTHILQRKPKASRVIAWWKVVLWFICVAITAAAIYFALNSFESFDHDHETADAKILEIRKVVDHTVDSRYGGKIFYRFEAHVQYVYNREMQDRWIRIADDLPSETLILKLADHPTHCLAHWPSRVPENARCSLY